MTEKVLVHGYLTSGMFELAKVFLDSLAFANGNHFRVILSTRDLVPEQIAELHNHYSDLSVENEQLDYVYLANRANCSYATLMKYKEEVEGRYVTKENKVWKLMIAAEDRPRSLYKLLERGEGWRYPILHFDIDTLFRKDITPLVDLGIAHDCCLLLRPNINPVKARITISTMTWKRNDRTLKFFERWMHHLDIMPPPQRPIGYGQTSCWYAFKDVPELITHTLSHNWGYPGKQNNSKSNFVWAGAIHKLAKDDCVKKFESELEGLQCES